MLSHYTCIDLALFDCYSYGKRIFLTQVLAVNGFPFEIKRANANSYEALTEQEILDKLEILRERAAQGMNRKAAENVLNDYDATTILRYTLLKSVFLMGREIYSSINQ